MFGRVSQDVVDMAKEARDLSMQMKTELTLHVRDCMELSRETKRTLTEMQQSLIGLYTKLGESGNERRDQFDTMNRFMWKIALGIISGLLLAIGSVLLEIAKSKSLI